MNDLTKKSLWVIPVVAGVLLTASATGSLYDAGNLRHGNNVFAIERSAYGRLLARLSETTIDRVWHLGVEQIVPHNIPGHSDSHASETGHEHCDHDHGVCEHDDGHDEHVAKGPRKSPIEATKAWFDEMRVVKYTRTNPYAINERHSQMVKREIEEMLLKSYRMDPTHYGAYNSYHLFLTTYDFGGNDKKRGHARLIAERTIAEVFKEKEDPEPWLTAASAAMNLFLLDTEKFTVEDKPIPSDILKLHQSRVGYCLGQFDQLQKQAEKLGIWENLSTERQIEITQRQRFAERTFGQFEAMIARADAAKSANDEGEVATSNGDEADN